MRILSSILLLIVVILGISFATLNSTAVNINYYIGKSTVPLSMLLTIAFALGCALGVLVGLWFILKLKLKIFRLRQRLSLAEKEIENLRAIPLQDKH